MAQLSVRGACGFVLVDKPDITKNGATSQLAVIFVTQSLGAPALLGRDRKQKWLPQD